MAKHKTVTLPSGQKVVLVNREQLRFKRHGRCFGIPDHLKAMQSIQLPVPPATWSGSKSRAIKYPILGNDTVGDCYYADACHAVQTFTGNGSGTPATFNASQVVNRYEVISGGDNGLSDSDIFPEWKGGIVGPAGPHKILDEMTVDPTDDAAIRLGMWLFCGASWTAALPDAWVNSAAPGATWGAGTSDSANGHAMALSGYGPSSYELETWGFDPAIVLLPAGLKSADPEVTLQFSLEMFNAQGIAPHNDMSYDQLATLWKQLGGATLPPSPFGPPTPVPPGPTPIPVPPPVPPPTPHRLFGFTLSRKVRKGGYIPQIGPMPMDVPAGKYDVSPAQSAVGAFPWATIIAVIEGLIAVEGPDAAKAIDAYLNGLPNLNPLVRAVLEKIVDGLLNSAGGVTVE